MSVEQPLFERCGVSVSFLRMFQRECLPVECTLTTTEVCNTIIMPATATAKTSFLDLYRDKLDEESRPYIAPATVFISHAWKYQIAEPLDVMLEHGEKHPNAYFWFDLFANNQHRAAQRPQEWWKKVFREAIAEIGAVVLVMSPWDNPIPITRAWCLWEILSAMEQPHVRFRVSVPRTMRKPFFECILDDPRRVLKALANIEAERAEATRPEDLEMIFDAIRSTVGFLQMNARVNKHLRQWYLRTAIEVAEEMPVDDIDQPTIARLHNHVGYLLEDLGDFDRALQHYQTALEINEKICGTEHVATSRTYNNIGSVYDSLGDWDRALEFYLRSLAIDEKIHDHNHPDVATSYSNIGLVFKHKGDMQQALEYYQLALTIRVKLLGEDHEDTATSCNNIGVLLHQMGEVDRALEFLQRAVDIRHKVLGETHPDVATAYNNIALVYDDKGDSTLALDYHRKALAIRRKTLGEHHPDVATSFNNIGLILGKQGDHEKALEYLQQALNIQQTAFGDEHPDTAATLDNVGFIMEQQGDAESALEFYQRALDIQVKTNGNHHPDTVDLQQRVEALIDQEMHFLPHHQVTCNAGKQQEEKQQEKQQKTGQEASNKRGDDMDQPIDDAQSSDASRQRPEQQPHRQQPQQQGKEQQKNRSTPEKEMTDEHDKIENGKDQCQRKNKKKRNNADGR